MTLVLAALEAVGWDRQRCSRQLGVQAEALDLRGHVQVSDVVRVLDLALEVGGPRFAQDAAVRMPRGALGLLDHLCGAAPTARAALKDLCRYFRLVSFGATLRMQADTLVLDLPEQLPVHHRRLLSELLFAVLAHRLQPCAPALAGLPGPALVPSEGPWATEKNDVSTGFLTFAAAELDRRFPSPDPALRTLLIGYATMELEARPSAATLRDRVVQVVLDALPGPAPSAGDVAATLGLSDRSLRRALQAEGLNYGGVRDRCLRRVAEQALSDPSRTIAEVAWLLGYSEVSAFHRAFRRWTGHTPRQFREAGQLGP